MKEKFKSGLSKIYIGWQLLDKLGFDFDDDFFHIREGLQKGVFQILAKLPDFTLFALRRHGTIQVHPLGIVLSMGSKIVKGDFIGTL